LGEHVLIIVIGYFFGGGLFRRRGYFGGEAIRQ
jgi:hypothetical protein